MLYFVVAWTALLVICGVMGTALLHGFKAERFVRVGDRLIAAEWIGLIVLANSLLAVSIVLPLTPGVGIGVALIGVTIALLLRSVRLELTALIRQLSWQHYWGYFALVLAVATLSDRPVTWVDSGLYHYGAIQWLAQYGTVTGIVLIFSNLGFVSSWFALAAPFNPPVLDGRGSAVANGFVLVLVGLQLAVYLIHSWRSRARPSDSFGLICFGLMLAAVLLYRLLLTIAVSPSADLPSTFLVGLVPWSMLVARDTPGDIPGDIPAAPDLPPSRRADDRVIPLLLSAGAVTIKLTALPLLLVSAVFYGLYSRRSLRQLCIGGAIGLVLLLPLLLAGIKASGCPLYPSSVLCLDVPWAQNRVTIGAVAQGTHGWMSWYGAPPAGQNPLLWAMGKWLRSERANQGAVVLAGITVLAIAGSVKPLLSSQMRGKFWVVTIAGTGLAFLMATAPFFRFALPYLLLIPSLLIVVWGAKLALSTWERMRNRLHRSTLFSRADRLTRITALIVMTISLLRFVHAPSRLLLPPPMQTVPVVQKQVNDLTYFSPQIAGQLCWATPLPCGFEIEKVRLRDADRGLAGGFVRQD